MTPLPSHWTSLVCLIASAAAVAAPADPRLREVSYDMNGVVTVHVKRGVVSLIVFGADESITEVASGLGADCMKPDAAWCVATQPGSRTLFVKPKSTADADNNLAVVTDKRMHSLRLVVLADGDPSPPVYRLIIKPPLERPVAHAADAHPVQLPNLPIMPAIPRAPSAEQVVAERLRAKPQVLNAEYSLAEGRGSQAIVPSLVFDDGRFTYLRFPGNRDVPVVFQVLGDGSEAIVNTRMEDDTLVIDRVSQGLMLRAGSAVVGIWNESFDPEGVAPAGGTTVPGVRRTLRSDRTVAVQEPKRGQP